MANVPHGIRSLKIENFRGIDKLELDFTDPQGTPSDIVAIGGPNGCGKTSVLEACLLAFGRTSAIQGSKGDNAVGPKALETKIEVEVAHATSAESWSSMTIGYRHSLEGTYWSINGETYQQPNYIASFSYLPSWRVPHLIGALPISSVNLGQDQSSYLYRDLPAIKQRMIDLKAYNLMNDGGETLYDHEKELQLLSQAWKRFYPRDDTTFFVGPVGTRPEDGFDVFYKRSGLKLSVDRMSAGQLELFILFGGLLRIVPLYSTLVFIDEPELHLDPQWHATLLHELRRFIPRSQFIVATHSPQVFDSVYSYQRHFLVSESDPRAKVWKAPDKEPVPA